MHFKLLNVFFKASVSVLTKKFYALFKKPKTKKSKNENFKVSSFYYISGVWCVLFVRVITLKPYTTNKLTVDPYSYALPYYKKTFQTFKPKII